MRPRDTTAAAEEVQLAVLRRMTPGQRTTAVAQMSAAVRTTCLAGIRSRHPDYDEATARWAMFRLLVGDELFAKAWPHAPLVAP